MKTAKKALNVLNTLSAPACGLAHERMEITDSGIRRDAPVCPAHVRATRISCAHCFGADLKHHASDKLVEALDFLLDTGAVSPDEHTAAKTIIRESRVKLRSADTDKNVAMHNREEHIAHPDEHAWVIHIYEAEMADASNVQRRVAGDLQDVLDLARERAAALVQRKSLPTA